MPYQRGVERTQTQLLPPSVEEYVAADAPVRVIDAFVESLDLEELGFVRARPAALGRPGYHPGDLLRLYIYGYLNRIRSSRRLEAEANRNLEVMWLLRGLRPDFKTIADFRRHNTLCFKGVLREFNLLCRKLNLLAAEIVAIDGSKFKASNNFRKSYTAGQLRDLIQKIDQGIAKYLEALDQADSEAEGAGGGPGQGSGGPRSALDKEKRVRDFQRKLADLQQEKEECASLLEELTKDEAFAKRGDIARTDRDSRRMKRGNGAGTLVGYNVQVAVDGKHGLILAGEVVTEANDFNQLSSMAAAALAVLEETGKPAPAAQTEPLEVTPVEVTQAKPLALLADSGYCEADELAACEAMTFESGAQTRGVEAFVPRRRGSQGQGAKDNTGKPAAVFPKDQFHYDAASDLYLCPAGQQLPRVRERLRNGKLNYLYKTHACTGCALKALCTTTKYRSLTRRANEAAVERARERVKTKPEMMAKRHELVERVFGTLRLGGHHEFLTRGLVNVRGEFSLSSLGYNLRRCLNILGVPTLVAHLKPV